MLAATAAARLGSSREPLPDLRLPFCLLDLSRQQQYVSGYKSAGLLRALTVDECC